MLSIKDKSLLLIVAIFVGSQFSYGEEILESDMDKNDSYSVVNGEVKSELQKFASWFHQDWKLIFPDFYEGAEMYLGNISPVQKKDLKRELTQFIDNNKNLSSSEIKKEWLKLGAQGWQSNLDILTTLNDFVKLIEK